jgi:hypothetical protein
MTGGPFARAGSPLCSEYGEITLHHRFQHEQMVLDPAIEERLRESRKSIHVQELLKDYLLGLHEADAEIELRPGDPNWAAVDGFHRGRHIVWVFPKSAKVKVHNRVPGSTPGHYGPGVDLTARGEWSIVIKSDDDVAVLLRITGDAIRNADRQRVWPPGLTPGSRARLAASVARADSRLGIPKSKRFAVLMRDDFTCQYCGRSAPEVELQVDHRTPVSRGGSDAVDNLTTACADCNLGKSDRFVT